MLSVVLPVYRTGTVFPELVQRLVAVLRTQLLEYEIVAVNDACPAGSGDAILQVASENGCVKAILLPTNVGQQRAVQIGVRSASGDMVLVMDADLQDAPEDIPALLRVLRCGDVDAVFAGRRGIYQSRFRMLTSRLFKWLIARILGVPRDAGSFVVMTRRMANAVAEFTGPHPYLLAVIGGSGLPVVSVPVARSSRTVGQSSYTAVARARFALQALRTAWVVRHHALRRPAG